MAEEYEIVIAGAGIAGLTAAMTAARLGRRTLLLTGDVPGGLLLSINRIDGYPGFPEGVPGYDLCPMAQEQAAAAGAVLASGELQSIRDQDGNYELTASEGQYLTQTLIIASGARLKTLGIPGEEQFKGKGVSHCASCDAPMLRNRAVAVIGGGDSALQEALTLADHASTVTILQRATALTAQAAYQQQVTTHPKISIRYHTQVEEILGNAAVTGVRMKDLASGATSNLEVAAVFAYIGLQPNAELLQDKLQLEASGHIPVDARMRTELKGILAAGIVRDGAAGRAGGAAGDGATAAIAADRYLTDLAWR